MNEHEKQAAGRRDDRAFKENAVATGGLRGGKSISHVSRDLGGQPVIVGTLDGD